MTCFVWQGRGLSPFVQLSLWAQAWGLPLAPQTAQQSRRCKQLLRRLGRVHCWHLTLIMPIEPREAPLSGSFGPTVHAAGQAVARRADRAIRGQCKHHASPQLQVAELQVASLKVRRRSGFEDSCHPRMEYSREAPRPRPIALLPLAHWLRAFAPEGTCVGLF